MWIMWSDCVGSHGQSILTCFKTQERANGGEEREMKTLMNFYELHWGCIDSQACVNSCSKCDDSVMLSLPIVGEMWLQETVEPEYWLQTFRDGWGHRTESVFLVYYWSKPPKSSPVKQRDQVCVKGFTKTYTTS